jgi:hypothetical protein
MRALVFILISLLYIACGVGDSKPIDPSDSTKFTTVQWIDTLVDFGSVTSGQRVNVQFRFKNTGKKPLIVATVAAGCGCTIPEYSKEPVMPGEEGYVKAVFNSINQPPVVHKTIAVGMNTKEQSYTLTFIGEVKNQTN